MQGSLQVAVNGLNFPADIPAEIIPVTTFQVKAAQKRGIPDYGCFPS